METIEKEWPTSVTHIAKHLGLYIGKLSEKERKSIVAKIVYHVRKLEKEEEIRLKKIGKTTIVWPNEIEKLRVLYEILK
mgnify:CR=1 FL=1